MDSVRIILRFHSLFYTPHFVAMYLGVFERQQVGVEVRTAKSGVELANALLKGEAELGLSGPIRRKKAVKTGSSASFRSRIGMAFLWSVVGRNHGFSGPIWWAVG